MFVRTILFFLGIQSTENAKNSYFVRVWFPNFPKFIKKLVLFWILVFQQFQ